jgi:hypothetical protein
MFEDIYGEKKKEKKPRNRINVMPKGQTLDINKPANPNKYKSHRRVVKRAVKIRKELKDAIEGGEK